MNSGPLALLLVLLALPLRAQPAADPAADEAAIKKALGLLKGYPSFRRVSKASPAEVALGHQLFFDSRLSRTRKLGCFSCHDPGKNWGDGLPQARVDGRPLKRKTIRLLATPFNRFLFWDGRAGSVEDAALIAVQNPKEMNQDLPGLAATLEAIPGYKSQFERVYGGGAIKAQDVGKALAAFILSLPISEDSAFDRFRKEGAGMSPEAVRGLILFMDKAGCARCHIRNKFFHNIGLKESPQPDLGRYVVDPREDNWKTFVTPSLRNVARMAPYMHDGRFETLREVIDFYDRGGDPDSRKDVDIVPLALTEDEKGDLEAFLKSLTTTIGTVASPALPPDPG